MKEIMRLEYSRTRMIMMDEKRISKFENIENKEALIGNIMRCMCL